MATATERRVVVTYSSDAATAPGGHEASTLKEIARRLAALTGFVYAGEYNPHGSYSVLPYFVPANTLTSEMASRLGIRGEHDLFGAVVPCAFTATKTITHPLLDAVSCAPEGWCPAFPSRVAGVVLNGISVFARQDALIAGRRLLAFGPVRVKRATGLAGLGQY